MALTRLRSLLSLPHLGQIRDSAEITNRFDSALLLRWRSLIYGLSKSFAIPGKVDEEDLRQELYLVLWRLSRTNDPGGDDFRRLFPAEAKNRCIDLTRYYQAQKRMARSGYRGECRGCGWIWMWRKGNKQCPACLSKEIRKSEVKIQDVRLDSESFDVDVDAADGGISTCLLVDGGTPEPAEQLGLIASVERIRSALEPFPERALFDLLYHPTTHFVRLLQRAGLRVDPRRAPFWLLARYFRVREKQLRLAYTKIGLVTATVLGRPELASKLSPYNLEQIGEAF